MIEQILPPKWYYLKYVILATNMMLDFYYIMM